MNILEIENLNASFPGKQVLHDVSLTVQTGRKLALVGESGSGKTVLAQGIMRLNPLVSFDGLLKFCGNDLLTQSECALQKLRGREIGMVFQEPMTALNPVMRVGAQIAEVLTLHLGLDKKQDGRGRSNSWRKPASASRSRKPLPIPSSFPADSGSGR